MNSSVLFQARIMEWVAIPFSNSIVLYDVIFITLQSVHLYLCVSISVCLSIYHQKPFHLLFWGSEKHLFEYGDEFHVVADRGDANY